MIRRSCRSQRQLWLFSALLALWAFGPPASAVAQGGGGGVVVGTLVDAQGGVLPGVSVTLRNVDSGLLRSGVSEGDGSYGLPGLPPGTYELTAVLPGFADATVTGVVINIGLEIRHDLTMSLEGLQETVTVTGEAPVIEVTQSQVAAVVTQDQIAMLPMANRQPISLALLLPGTAMDSTSVRRSQASIGAGGAGNTMNIYHVDGGMNMSNNSGQQHLEVPQAAIQEFKVSISQATAEYGAIGGVVLIASKSGTNRFSGEFFEYFRDKSLNTFNAKEEERNELFGDAKPDYRRNTYGGAFGGPIILDRLHFFFAAERSKRDTSFTVDTGVPEFYSGLHGNFPQLYERRAVFGRADLQINSSQNLFMRYTYDMEIIVCEGCGGSTAAQRGQNVRSPRDSNLIGHTWVIGNRMLNEFRTQIPPSHLNHRSGPYGLELFTGQSGDFDAPGRFDDFKDVFFFPSTTWGRNNWSVSWTDRIEIRDDFSMPIGNHSLKFGGSFVNLHSPSENSTNRGEWTFETDQFFDGSPAAMANLMNPSEFEASDPPVIRNMQNHWLNGYIQDDWRATDNLTINLGLRYDNQYRTFNYYIDLTGRERMRELIDPKNRGDNNNFGPRLGFAWDATGDGTNVVRGAFGQYFQYVMQGGMRPEMVALRQPAVSIDNPGYPDPYGGLSFQDFVAGDSTPNLRYMDDDLRNAKATNFSLGYSRELAPSLALHLDASHVNVVDLTQEARNNTPDPVTGAIEEPGWGTLRRLQAGRRHEYRALFARLEKRFSDNYQFLVSYTLSKQDNDGAGTAPPITNYHDPSTDWGPGDADRRHALVASGSYLFPGGINFGAVWTMRSGMPFSATAGRDLNGDRRGSSDYVPGTTRNQGNRDVASWLPAVNAWRATQGRDPVSASDIDTNEYRRFDVRASKSFGIGGSRNLELIAQVFNVFGRDNLGRIRSTWTKNSRSNSFGQILDVQDRQQMEVALRFSF